MSSTTRDRDGRLVRVGSRVRLLRIVPWLLKIIPEEEKSDRLSMVGEIFEVQAIEDGRAHLEKWLNSSPTSFTAYAYDAEAHEIEFAKRSDGPANPQNAPRPEWPLTRRSGNAKRTMMMFHPLMGHPLTTNTAGVQSPVSFG